MGHSGCAGAYMERSGYLYDTVFMYFPSNPNQPSLYVGYSCVLLHDHVYDYDVLYMQ